MGVGVGLGVGVVVVLRLGLGLANPNPSPTPNLGRLLVARVDGLGVLDHGQRQHAAVLGEVRLERYRGDTLGKISG